MLRQIFRNIRKIPSTLLSKQDTKTIKNLLDRDSIVLLDLGAAGGVEPRWKKIAPVISYIGFEPDTRAQEFTPNSNFTNYELLPFAAGEHKGIRKLYVTKDAGKSSMFLPNYEFFRGFQTLADLKPLKK